LGGQVGRWREDDDGPTVGTLHVPAQVQRDKPDLSTTSTADCTKWSGKILNWGDTVPPYGTAGAPSTVEQLVGWWLWP